MTKYSDWIIIPADRKCDLPLDTKVQVIRKTEGVSEAERQTPRQVSDLVLGLKWAKNLFAYRYVIELAEEVREYECLMNFRDHEVPLITWCFPKDIENWKKGTATQTKRNDKPYDFHWRVSE